MFQDAGDTEGDLPTKPHPQLTAKLKLKQLIRTQLWGPQLLIRQERQLKPDIAGGGRDR